MLTLVPTLNVYDNYINSRTIDSIFRLENPQIQFQGRQLREIPSYCKMSLGELALWTHAQSRNDLNLESIAVIDIYSVNVPLLTKKFQMDLNHFVHVFGMLVFKCPVDNTSPILGQ